MEECTTSSLSHGDGMSGSGIEPDKPQVTVSPAEARLHQNKVGNVMLYGVPIVSLFIDARERLCLAQISNTLLKDYSYNEIHNRRVALGITCVQCTPVQLEILRRAGAMPISSRRCGMITKREAERLVKSFLEDISPPKLPENFSFDVYHECGWGCKGAFIPSRYNSSRAKCIRCSYCNLFFSPNKFIFHFHRTDGGKYHHPDAANFNSWRRHLKLDCTHAPEDLVHAWEDVKAMFNGGSRKRLLASVKPVKEPGEVETKRRKSESSSSSSVWRAPPNTGVNYNGNNTSNPFLPPFMSQSSHPAFTPATDFQPTTKPQSACVPGIWKNIPNPFLNPYALPWMGPSGSSYPHSEEFPNPPRPGHHLEYPKEKQSTVPYMWPVARKDQKEHTYPNHFPFHLNCDVGQCFSAFTPVYKDSQSWFKFYHNYKHAWNRGGKPSELGPSLIQPGTTGIQNELTNTHENSDSDPEPDVDLRIESADRINDEGSIPKPDVPVTLREVQKDDFNTLSPTNKENLEKPDRGFTGINSMDREEAPVLQRESLAHLESPSPQPEPEIEEHDENKGEREAAEDRDKLKNNNNIQVADQSSCEPDEVNREISELVQLDKTLKEGPDPASLDNLFPPASSTLTNDTISKIQEAKAALQIFTSKIEALKSRLNT